MWALIDYLLDRLSSVNMGLVAFVPVASQEILDTAVNS